MYQHFEFPFVAFCNFSQYIFNKIYCHILTQISQSWAKHVYAFYIIFSIVLAIFAYYAGIVLNYPIMLKIILA